MREKKGNENNRSKGRVRSRGRSRVVGRGSQSHGKQKCQLLYEVELFLVPWCFVGWDGEGAPPLQKSRGMSSGKRRRERDEVAFGPLGRVGFGSSGGVALYCV
jgi:hypothetical protein